MHVLVDAVTAPGDPRGVGRYARELSGALARRGDVQVSLAHAAWHADFFATLAAKGVRLVPVDLPSGARFARHAWQALRVRPLARRLGVDVVHATDRVPAAWSGRPALVATIQDVAEYDEPDAYGRVQRRYRRLVLDRQLARTPTLIAPTRFSAERIALLRPDAAGRTTVIANGPGITKATAAVAPAAAIGRPFLLCVGAVQRHKNVPAVTRAHRALERSDVWLVICGADHNDRAAVDEAIAGRTGVVRLPRPTDAELAWLYGNAAALVFPSRYEGFGLPIVEAMAFGCPVITSDRGAMKEVAGEAALLVDPGDDAAILRALERVLDDATLVDQLRIAGRARSARYSWDRTAEETLAVYRAAAGREARDA